MSGALSTDATNVDDATCASDATGGEATPEQLAFSCPRCAGEVRERFYGPCGTCRSDLRDAQGVESREVEAVEYEPKMNVTPNAVATKD